MYRLLLHPFFLAVLVTLLIWFGVIVYWQETVRLVTAEDIGIYLVGLPLLVVGGGLVARAAYRHAKDKTTTSASPGATANVAAPAGDERERGLTLAVLAVGLASAAGNGATDAFLRLKARDLQPCPDGEIRNRDGFPVFTCRVEALDIQPAKAVTETAGVAAPDSVLRGLALLEQALSPVVEKLASLVPPKAGGKREAVDSPALPKVSVSLIMPTGWAEPFRSLAAKQLAVHLEEAGWPSESVTLTAVSGDEGTAPLRLLDAFCLDAGRHERTDYKLVVACESALDEDVVAEFDTRGVLFSPTRPQGVIPGEAAVALLVQRPLPQTAGDTPPMAVMHRGAFAVRDKSADAAGRISHVLLAETAQGGIGASQVPAADVACVVSDIDHRGSRSGECASAINEVLPDIDPVQSFFGAGQALGSLGTTGPLFALGLAVGAVQEERKAVLMLSAAHPTERAALLLKPHVEPAANAAPAA